MLLKYLRWKESSNKYDTVKRPQLCCCHEFILKTKYVLDQIIEEQEVDPNYAFEMHKYFNE